MKNKALKLMSILFVLTLVLVGCGKETDKPAGGETNTMKYISREDLKENIESKSDEYVILDARKVKDYDTSHIDGAYTADQDAANKGGDDEKGKENLKVALKEATGSETGNPDDKYALVCYSGKSYAQKATDLMIDLGISADQIYTLEGGMEAWEKGGEEYKALLK
ncbi:rhodanese-like domain-containing protein [Tissierella creatinophila]|uniref:Thiosulfate sulfurtransferase GlpE n=1 Tax=Tissierella creatinophila DSM 6911 TaxID=1123403 RepID=A0A1U7M613_TISCR|nr:rhodanese-like domain-containing protein [Tissierella creatinophila]OLS02762.1 thiosulfate sulfurtransferase GlpE [Tissierella creatinophila DSM 6911]